MYALPLTKVQVRTARPSAPGQARAPEAAQRKGPIAGSLSQWSPHWLNVRRFLRFELPRVRRVQPAEAVTFNIAERCGAADQGAYGQCDRTYRERRVLIEVLRAVGDC